MKSKINLTTKAILSILHTFIQFWHLQMVQSLKIKKKEKSQVKYGKQQTNFGFLK